MSKTLTIKHLTVTGFKSDKKKSPSSKAKSDRKNSEDAKESILGLKDDFRDASEKAFQIFKKESAKKLDDIERKISGLNLKIKTANHELAAIYQNQMDELEHSKRTLISKLDEYKEVGDNKWNSFKEQFGSELKGLEDELIGFMDNFKEK